MRRLLMLLMTFVLLMMPASALGQDATPAATASLGGPVTVYGTDAQPAGEITLIDLVDPFDGWDAGSPPTRGYRWVMANISATAGATDWQINSSGFSITDSDGYIAYQTYVYRSEDAITALPDLPGDVIPAGKTVSGAVFFLVYVDAEIGTLEYSSSSDDLTLIHDFRTATAAAGTAVEVTETDGSALVSVTLDGVIDPFQDFDPGSPPDRGFRFVGIVVTVENTGTRPISIDVGRFTAVDYEGFVYGYTTIYRTSESTTQLPDLPYATLEPGQTATGLVAFSLISGANIAKVTYQPTYERRIRIAEFVAGEPYPEPDLAALPTPEPADPSCAEAITWLKSLETTLTPVSGVLDTIEAVDIADPATPGTLREAADQLRSIATDTAGVETPESVADASAQIVGTLNELADQADALATAAEGNDQAAFDTATTAMETALTNLLSGAYGELATRCPEIADL